VLEDDDPDVRAVAQGRWQDAQTEAGSD
jgi:hypothetical protein